MNLGTILDFLMVVFGFSLIVVIHEAGHFLAARWAGVRVLAFAVGFGPAFLSFRKGLGWRRGSSETEYRQLPAVSREAVSPTEYRLNSLPFGGYVKMLGQDDLDPSAISDAKDSYQRCPTLKRMVIISAGVVFNLITAAIMFIVVFGVGLRAPAPSIGHIERGSPADGGLRPGDRVLRINNHEVRSFNDIASTTAMSSRNAELRFEVLRNGETLTIPITPRIDRNSRLLEVGVGPAASAEIIPLAKGISEEEFTARMRDLGLGGVEPGMRLTKAGDIENPTTGEAVHLACQASGGKDVPLSFASKDGRTVNVQVTPSLELEAGEIRVDPKQILVLEHLMGMVPVMSVGELTDDMPGAKAGLREGDIFAKLGEVSFPSMYQGTSEIRSKAGKTVNITVLRYQPAAPTGNWVQVEFPSVSVSGEGRIGITIRNAAERHALLATTPPEYYLPHTLKASPDRPILPPEGDVLGRTPCRIVAVNDSPVENLSQVRDLLQAVTAPVRAGAVPSVDVKISVVPTPRADAAFASDQTPVQVTLTLGTAEAQRLGDLSWRSPFGDSPFAPMYTILKASNPIEALTMGLDETKRVMSMTYMTFARLFEGTVRVQHLKGPVGIAHLGTQIASQGFVTLLFFFALISVNLAVVNFLPMPIVDGGQLLLLIYEHIRGRPAPIAFQNAATLAGLLLIGSLFLLITFNDIRGLII